MTVSIYILLWNMYLMRSAGSFIYLKTVCVCLCTRFYLLKNIFVACMSSAVYQAFLRLKQPVSKGMYSPQQHPASQRQVVVRRFQTAIHLDLLLILKLAAVIFLLNQDGSRQRLVLLVFFASLVYL